MYHCITCRKQFKTLASEEDYEFCPICGNDLSVNPGPLPEELKAPQKPVKYKKKEFDIEAWRKNKADKEGYEERRLKHYHEVYKREGQVSAERAYLYYSEDNFKQ